MSKNLSRRATFLQCDFADLFTKLLRLFACAFAWHPAR